MMLLVEKKHGVARVTLNRPDVRNAFDEFHGKSSITFDSHDRLLAPPLR
jgi:1,4-dihydroxy-2-naphthoyl-CoA synthase